MPNNVLELTRLSRLELRVVFGFADGLPAKTLLQTRLTAQHCRSAGARAAEHLNGDVIRLRRRSAGLRSASPHGGASKPPASPPLGGAAHLAPIRQPLSREHTRQDISRRER